MKTNEYLYGETTPPNIPQEVIDERVTILNKELTKELDKFYTTRDTVRVNNLVNAIQFWSDINDNSSNTI